MFIDSIGGMMIEDQPIREGNTDLLRWKVYADRQAMGRAASAYAEEIIVRHQRINPEMRVLFAAAPSQNELLAGLAVSQRIDWTGITAFHMDEYLGLDGNAPQGFGRFLREHLFGHVPVRCVHFLDIAATDHDAECRRYATLLDAAPIHLCCLGIGENGHIAFNDPPVADFDDPFNVKIVTLDSICRRQQVNDGCFETLDDVPTRAITLTVPALMRAETLCCVVPAVTKRDAVHRLLHGPIATDCPATAMRRHGNATLFLEAASAGLLKPEVR